MGLCREWPCYSNSESKSQCLCDSQCAPVGLLCGQRKNFFRNFSACAIKSSPGAFHSQKRKTTHKESEEFTMKKSYIAAALALTSCLVLGTAAASQSKTVTATFRPDMTLKVNGTTYTVRDTTGVRVSPLVYNGTTYLPLASLSQLLVGKSFYPYQLFHINNH